MSGLIDAITQQLGSGTLSQVSGALGVDENKTQKAVASALPVLIGALAKNSSSEDGAQSLASALERDHDGSLLDNLGGLLGGGGLGALLGGGQSGGGLGDLLGAAGSLLGGGSAPSKKTLDGDGILGHVLGTKRQAVEQGISKSSGLDAGQAGKVLSMLAPIVMGALGKAKRDQGLDAGGLAGMLSQERASIEKQMPNTELGGLLGMLDRDDDGSIVDDIASLGGKALGSILGK